MAESLLPDAEDDLELLHTRRYETRVYLRGDDQLVVRGAISDKKPAGLYVDDDPDELEIHRMLLELEVSTADLSITDARVGFEAHPSTDCPTIADHYRQLIGLNVARGFTRHVRDLFGGPRGCSHTTALLQAMAPAVVQSLWSVNMRRWKDPESPRAEERRERALMSNLNTCHIWAEDGVHVAAIRSGEPRGVMLPVKHRLEELGRDPDDHHWK